jgi:hypothetical protein
VYIRPLNGRGLNPPAPRHIRAIQYYGYPGWKFDRLREEEPDGGWEQGADIAPGEWTHLRLDIDERRLVAHVNGVVALDIAQAKLDPADGQIGLWVDIGTEGYFTNLQITPANQPCRPSGP